MPYRTLRPPAHAATTEAETIVAGHPRTNHLVLCPTCGRSSPPPPAYEQIGAEEHETIDCLKKPRRALNLSEFQTESYVVFGSITAAVVVGRPFLLDLKRKLRCLLLLIVADPDLPRDGTSIRRVMKQLDDYDLLDLFHSLAPAVPVWIPQNKAASGGDFCHCDCIYLSAFDQVRELRRYVEVTPVDRQKPYSACRTYFVDSDKANIVRWHQQMPNTKKIFYTPAPGWQLPSLTVGAFTGADEYNGHPVSAGAIRALKEAKQAAEAAKIAAAKAAAEAAKIAATKAAAQAEDAAAKTAIQAEDLKASRYTNKRPNPRCRIL